MSEELSGGFVDGSDVEVVDDQDDGGSFLFAADHDVMHSPSSPQRASGPIDLTTAADRCAGGVVVLAAGG